MLSAEGYSLCKFRRRGFRRLRAAAYFAHGGKVGKTPPGTAPDEHFVLIVAHPTPSGPSGHLPLTGGVGPGPHYGGRIPASPSKISGAQNLSGTLNSRRATGPWVCKICPWCGSRSAPEFASQRSRSVFRRRGGLWPPAGAHSAPLRKNESASEYAIGAGVLTRPPTP